MPEVGRGQVNIGELRGRCMNGPEGRARVGVAVVLLGIAVALLLRVWARLALLLGVWKARRGGIAEHVVSFMLLLHYFSLSFFCVGASCLPPCAVCASWR